MTEMNTLLTEITLYNEVYMQFVAIFKHNTLMNCALLS